jgi:hypothetical protein
MVTCVHGIEAAMHLDGEIGATQTLQIAFAFAVINVILLHI